jgi:hypothetical protein
MWIYTTSVRVDGLLRVAESRDAIVGPPSAHGLTMKTPLLRALVILTLATFAACGGPDDASDPEMDPAELMSVEPDIGESEDALMRGGGGGGSCSQPAKTCCSPKGSCVTADGCSITCPQGMQPSCSPGSCSGNIAIGPTCGCFAP